MTTITVTGNVGTSELRYTPSGQAVLNLSIAHNRRRFDKTRNEWTDAGTDWYRAALWGEKAEAAAEVAVKGARVIVVGEYESRAYESASGKGTAWEIRATDVGIVPRGTGAATARPDDDPWAAGAAGAGDAGGASR